MARTLKHSPCLYFKYMDRYCLHPFCIMVSAECERGNFMSKEILNEKAFNRNILNGKTVIEKLLNNKIINENILNKDFFEKYKTDLFFCYFKRNFINMQF